MSCVLQYDVHAWRKFSLQHEDESPHPSERTSEMQLETQAEESISLQCELHASPYVPYWQYEELPEEPSE